MHARHSCGLFVMLVKVKKKKKKRNVDEADTSREKFIAINHR